jgi:hypothetical protein
MKQLCFSLLGLVATIAVMTSEFLGFQGTAAAQSVSTGSPALQVRPWPKPVDPGPRAGPPGAGGPLAGVGANQQKFFAAARSRFQEIDSVSGTIPGEAGVGLGPRFNLNGCAGCHAFPAIGGSSPVVNPQVAMARLDGAQNVVPPFIKLNGPVREARFIRNTDGTPDSGVHNLFVISGRADALRCGIKQPDFAAALAARNVSLRIPTPLFGLGLVENTPDDNLR